MVSASGARVILQSRPGVMDVSGVFAMLSSFCVRGSDIWSWIRSMLLKEAFGDSTPGYLAQKDDHGMESFNRIPHDRS